MHRWLGLLGSWALFVLGFGLTSIAVAGGWINIQDSQKLRRYSAIEKLLGDRVADKFSQQQQARERSEFSLKQARSNVTTASRTIDQHYIEIARKKGMNVVRLNPGQSIDADTGRAARPAGGGVWGWIGDSGGSQRVLKVLNNTVVEVSQGVERELPAGPMIRAGNTLIIPPAGTPQRELDKALAKEKADEKRKQRGKRLQERGESIFGRK